MAIQSPQALCLETGMQQVFPLSREYNTIFRKGCWKQQLPNHWVNPGYPKLYDFKRCDLGGGGFRKCPRTRNPVFSPYEFYTTRHDDYPLTPFVAQGSFCLRSVLNSVHIDMQVCLSEAEFGGILSWDQLISFHTHIYSFETHCMYLLRYVRS